MHSIQAVIFDLDGVIVSTDELHYQAWQLLADRESIPFTRQDNEKQRGVSRMESLEVILANTDRQYSENEKQALATFKNDIYKNCLKTLSTDDILPGVTKVIEELKKTNIKIAIGSSSRNAKAILKAIGLIDAFNIIVDGTDISRSKPDPEIFLLAAKRLEVSPEYCLVVEDAMAGVDSGIAAGMKVLAVGSATTHPSATQSAADLSQITTKKMLNV